MVKRAPIVGLVVALMTPAGVAWSDDPAQEESARHLRLMADGPARASRARVLWLHENFGASVAITNESSDVLQIDWARSAYVGGDARSVPIAPKRAGTTTSVVPPGATLEEALVRSEGGGPLPQPSDMGQPVSITLALVDGTGETQWLTQGFTVGADRQVAGRLEAYQEAQVSLQELLDQQDYAKRTAGSAWWISALGVALGGAGAAGAFTGPDTTVPERLGWGAGGAALVGTGLVIVGSSNASRRKLDTERQVLQEELEAMEIELSVLDTGTP